jgi:hypothetical protein
MKSSKTNIVRACALAVASVGLSLATAYITPASAQQPQTEQWCINIGGANVCHPTLAQCEAAHPGKICVKGPS